MRVHVVELHLLLCPSHRTLPRAAVDFVTNTQCPRRLPCAPPVVSPTAATLSWDGNEVVGYFGGATTIGDWNHDGVEDVAISSWGHSTPGLPQVCVWVCFECVCVSRRALMLGHQPSAHTQPLAVVRSWVCV